MTPVALLIILHASSFDACINRRVITSQNYWRCQVERGRARGRR